METNSMLLGDRTSGESRTTSANHSSISSKPQSKRDELSKPSRWSAFKQSWMFRLWTECPWSMEISYTLLNFSAILGIVTILFTMNQRPSREWNFFITINGSISALSTLAQGTMMAVTAECISQHKWSWFLQERKLKDLKTFDDTTRNSFKASMKLILTIRSFAIIGAFIVLANMAFGTFLQQVVDFPLRPISRTSNEALAPRARQFTTGGGTILWGYRASILASVLEPVSKFDYKPICPTGNCTWDTYPTLGICTKCKSLTTWKTDCKANQEGFYRCSYSLPGIASFPIKANFSVGAKGGPQGLMGANVADNASSHFLNVNNPIYTFIAISFNRSEESVLYESGPRSADLCSFYYCIQNWNVTANNANIKHIEDIRNWYNNTPTAVEDSSQKPSKYTNITLTPSAQQLGLNASTDNETFHISANAQSALKTYLGEVFSANQTSYRTGPKIWDDSTSSGDITRAVWKFKMSKITRSVAIAFSQRLSLHDSNVAFRVIGTAITYEPVVVVRWAWTTFPFGIVVISAMFLWMTIAKSARKPPWKSSNSAMLLNGPDGVDVGASNRAGDAFARTEAHATLVIRQVDELWKFHVNPQDDASVDDGSGDPEHIRAETTQETGSEMGYTRVQSDIPRTEGFTDSVMNDIRDRE